MKASFFRKAAVAVAMVTSFGMGVPSAHAAASDVAVVAGSGSISPGLPCSPCVIDFDFNAVDVGSATGAYLGCTFHADSPAESEVGGSGVGTLAGCGIGGTVGYSRVGVVVTVQGEVTVGSITLCIQASALVFVPTSVLPTVSFVVTGTVILGPCEG
jgi:hypothetical protein